MTELEQIIGYTFKNPELLKEALTQTENICAVTSALNF